MFTIILKTTMQFLHTGFAVCGLLKNNAHSNDKLNKLCRQGWLSFATLLLSVSIANNALAAGDTVCARVKIEIKQELTLERQAFDAEMILSNALDTDSLTEVSVVVNVTDELGVPVLVTSDPNNTAAKFFVRLSSKKNISDVDGTGSVASYYCNNQLVVNPRARLCWH